MKDHIDTILDQTIPHQTTSTSEERFARLVQKITPLTVTVEPIPSPYAGVVSRFTSGRVLVGLFLIFLLSTSGTVVASESARPGDLLFPIERATEQLRLVLASNETRAELERQFLDKRFIEIKQLLEEEVSSSDLERGSLSELGELRIANAVAVLLTQVKQPTEEQSERLRRLLGEIEMLPVQGNINNESGSRIKIDDNRIEVRTDTERVRIDTKDGTANIRYDVDNDDSEYDDKRRSDDGVDGSNDAGRIETNDDQGQREESDQDSDEKDDSVGDMSSSELEDSQSGESTTDDQDRNEDNNRGSGHEDNGDDKRSDDKDEEAKDRDRENQ